NAAHVADDVGLTCSRRYFNETPVKAPVLIRLPPTSLLMHSSVTYSLVTGSARRSCRVRLTGLPAMPPIFNRQLPPSTFGSPPKFFDTTSKFSTGGSCGARPLSPASGGSKIAWYQLGPSLNASAPTLRAPRLRGSMLSRRLRSGSAAAVSGRPPSCSTTP